MLEKEYVCLYLSRFFYAFAAVVIDVYGTVFLYNNGISAAQIFVSYGLRFGLMGLLTPFSAVISSAYGVGGAYLTANLARIAVSYLILFGNGEHMVLLVFLLSIPGAVGNPLAAVLSAKYVDTQNRGRYNGMRTACKAVGGALASFVVLYLVDADLKNLLFAVVAAAFLIDAGFMSVVSFKPEKSKNSVFLRTLDYIRYSRDGLKTIYVLRTFHIATRLFMPLYLFLVLQDFRLFSTVVSFSLCLQVGLLLLSGYSVDKNILKTNNVITAIRILLMVVFVATKNKVIVSLNKVTFDNVEQIYDLFYSSSLENILKKSQYNHHIAACSGEMCLCFAELFFFAVMGGIACIDVTYAFVFMFGGDMLSTYIMNRKIRQFKSLSNVKADDFALNQATDKCEAV